MHDHLGNFVTNFLSTIRSRGAQYDVVYSHYWDAGWAGQKIAEELQIPHVHTPHSLGAWKQENMGTDLDEHQADYRFEERTHKEFLVFQTCDHIIATTEPQFEQLQQQYDVLERHITVIPPGMDENRFIPVRQKEREQLQKRYGIKSNDVFVVGRMAANKGYDLLLEAMPTVFELVPDARLLAGIGSEESKQDEEGVAELKKLAKELDIAKKIVWTPYIPTNRLA
jgi:mannosylfructose-phosphate synthase